jgi:regulator of replication initiation timing
MPLEPTVEEYKEENDSLKIDNMKLRVEIDDLRRELSAAYESQRQLLEELRVQNNSVDSLLQEKNKRE